LTPVISEVFQGIPRYLFRVYSPQSNGINKSEEIASGAVVNEIPSPDIFSLKGDVARRMVTSHLEWRRNKAGNLVSWTCSLLFALQHAIRREATDRGSFTSEDIRLCVVDTTLLPLGTFIPASILTIKLGISLFYTAEDHEIFSQGTVDIMDKSVTTSLASLSQSGLYLFLPKLMVKQALLKSRVRQLREQLFRKPLRATSEEVTQAREIASTCFGGDFEQPMLILLLALRKRPDRDSLIVNEIISDASDKGDPNSIAWQTPKLTHVEKLSLSVWTRKCPFLGLAWSRSTGNTWRFYRGNGTRHARAAPRVLRPKTMIPFPAYMAFLIVSTQAPSC
jgi:hypothetical protein